MKALEKSTSPRKEHSVHFYHPLLHDRDTHKYIHLYMPANWIPWHSWAK